MVQWEVSFTLCTVGLVAKFSQMSFCLACKLSLLLMHVCTTIAGQKARTTSALRTPGLSGY